MQITIAADHAGFTLKEHLGARLADAGHAIHDLGPFNDRLVEDYCPITLLAAAELIDGVADRVIYCCGNGFAMAMLANRLPGVRAAVCHDMFTARTVREMADCNAISFGARIIAPELAWDLTALWLSTPFRSDVERYRTRLARVAEVEGLLAQPEWRSAIETYLAQTAASGRPSLGAATGGGR